MCGSHGLSARRARRTKSRGPKGLKLEVGARRAPRLLVNSYNHIFSCQKRKHLTKEPVHESAWYRMDESYGWLGKIASGFPLFVFVTNTHRPRLPNTNLSNTHACVLVFLPFRIGDYFSYLVFIGIFYIFNSSKSMKIWVMGVVCMALLNQHKLFLFKCGMVCFLLLHFTDSNAIWDGSNTMVQ